MAPQKPNGFRVHALAILAVRYGRELGEQVAAIRNAPAGDLPRTSLAAAGNFVFWFETLGVFAFATAWLTKGNIIGGVANLTAKMTR